MIRDTIVQVASIVFAVACLVYVTYVVGYLLFTLAKRQETPETFEAFWDKLESQGARYTEQEAEALYAIYQAQRGQMINSTDRKENSV